MAAVGTVGDSVVVAGRDRAGLAAWTSADGAEWQRHSVPDPTFLKQMVELFGPSIYDGTRMGPIATLGDTTFSIGTFYGPNDFYRPVGWRSTDGKTWEFIESESEFYSGGAVTDVETLGEGLVAARLTGLNGPSYSLWTWSPDTSWQETRIQSADKAHLVRLDAAPVGNGVVVVGQVAENDMLTNLGANHAVAWTSTDGQRWRELDLPQGMASACGVEAAPTDGFTVMGLRPNGDAAAWTTSDGATWSRFDLGSGYCVDPEPIRLAGDWMVASVSTGVGSKVWLSSDGLQWVRQDIPEIYSVAAAGINGELHVLGTPPDDRPFRFALLHGTP